MSSAALPPPPSSPVAPSWRARLWRPTRWRLWVQSALLGAFVLIIPILLTSRLLLEAGRNVLVEHETIDLSDDSNLRVNEFQDDFAYLARDVRLEAIQREDLPPADAVKGMLEGISLPDEALGDQPRTVREARRRFLHGCSIGVYAVDASRPGEVEILAQSAPPERDPARGKALLDCLGDLARRQRGVDERGRPNPYDRSGFWLQPADASRPQRCILALGIEVRKSERRGQLYALVIDFTRYVRNRQRTSPRHLYFVADPKGELLIHPYGDEASREPDLTKLLPWNYPEENWFDTSAPKNVKQERLGKAVRSGGARLSATTIPDLGYTYRKGYFGDGLELKKSLPNADPFVVSRDFNRLMEKELDADAVLRVGQISADFGYVEVSHPDRAKLEAVCLRIDDWHGQQGPSKPVKWSDPIACIHLQGQLTPLRIDQNDSDDPSWLVVGASPEELREDIDDQFSRIAIEWVYPTLLVSCLLGIALVVTLTRSLRRLVKSARELSRGEDVSIPLGGPYEVSQLAHTLAEMTNRVRHRDRELRDRAARYETILRVAGEGVVITNSAGSIEEVNRAAAKMFGYTSDELLGKPVTILVKNPAAMPNSDEAMTSTLTVMGRGIDTIQGLRKDGTIFWLEINLKPVPLKDRTVVTCIFRDVSLRKEAEERVRKLNDDLESRVRIRTAELEEANTKLDGALKQAEAASRAKDAFVANMSHELRQPLHIIIGFTEALKEDAADLGTDNIQPDLNKILGAAKHLLDLINDILDMAKISSGKMEMAAAPFDLAAMLTDLKTLVGPLAEKNANTFVVELPTGLGQMVADERRVRQILINLLSNSFKFTRGGTVTLGVRPLREGDRDWVQFSVKDTGKGMSQDQVQRLFQRFYQADSSTTRDQGGTGLGLSITQNFSDLMGGQPIRVKSERGLGSEFLVTLPLRGGTDGSPNPIRAVHLELPNADDAPAITLGRTVLVIDDDPMVRELMERFLAKDGFRVVQATDGDEGLRLAREELPCVITLDVMMPGSDGWSVLAHLKSDPQTADIPVVMLTMVDDFQRGFALGAADYFTKPIDWQRLGKILRKYLAHGHADTVLVVEDNAESREIVRKYLEREGWKIVEAADGEQGLKAFAEARPALILLDLMMPVLDGFGFLDELAKKFPSHRVPVVVLTAKELDSADFVRLNGRVARILEKGDLAHLEKLMELIRQHARK